MEEAGEELGLIAQPRGLDMETHDVEAPVQRTAIVVSESVSAGDVDEDRVEPRQNVAMPPAPVDRREVRDHDVGLASSLDDLGMGLDGFDIVAADETVVSAPTLERSFDEVAGHAAIDFVPEKS